MLTDRERLMLAVCIGEWATVIGALDALERMGQTVHAHRGRARRELTYFCDLWAADQGNPMPDNERSVTEARAYCTEHQSRLDELLNGE